MQRLSGYWWIVLPGALLLSTVIALSRPLVCLRITKAFHDLSTLRAAVDNFRRINGALPDESRVFEVMLAADQT